MATGKTTYEYRCFSCYHGWGVSGIQVAKPINMADWRLCERYYNSTVMPAEIDIPVEARDAHDRLCAAFREAKPTNQGGY